jgi:hypothetical protein
MAITSSGVAEPATTSLRGAARERAAGDRQAVLTNAVNIGIGTK